MTLIDYSAFTFSSNIKLYMKRSDANVKMFYLNLNKCLDVNVVLLMFIPVLLIKITLNLSSNFTLMAMYRSFSMQLKLNNWT